MVVFAMRTGKCFCILLLMLCMLSSIGVAGAQYTATPTPDTAICWGSICCCSFVLILIVAAILIIAIIAFGLHLLMKLF